MAKKQANELSITIGQLLTNRDDIMTLSGTVKAEGKKLDQQIQVVLASVCVHAHIHGDFTMINNVLDNLSKGIRTNAAKAYAEAFGPVRWNKKEKKFVFDANKRREDVMDSGEFLANLLGTDWLSFRPEPEFRPVDALAATESLLKRITGAAESGEEGHKVNADEIAIIRRALAEITAARGAAAREAAEAEIAEQAEQAE